MANDGWESRSNDDLFVLGEPRDGQHEKVQGLLIKIEEDRKYEGNYKYHFEQRNGDVLIVPGSTTMNRQIGPQDIGLFMRIKYLGTEKGRNGRFKTFDIQAYTGTDFTEGMREYPSFRRMQEKREAVPHGRHPSQMPRDERDERPARDDRDRYRDDPRKPDRYPDDQPRAARTNEGWGDDDRGRRDERPAPRNRDEWEASGSKSRDRDEKRSDTPRSAEPEDDLPF